MNIILEVKYTYLYMYYLNHFHHTAEIIILG